jgi:transcriptional regulator with XRE-family HTH domain
MGRKRAAFAEGIAEEEARYAQVLRDIGDLRGETQQALGNLLGLSVSMVSRFEAAAERSNEATHRRYCALAPTEELREGTMAAYEALPAPPERHAAPVRMSLEESHGRALDGPGLYRFFEAAYPEYPVLGLFNNEARPLSVWVEAAPREQWADVEAPIGTLDLSQPPPNGAATTSSPPGCSNPSSRASPRTSWKGSSRNSRQRSANSWKSSMAWRSWRQATSASPGPSRHDSA